MIPDDKIKLIITEIHEIYGHIGTYKCFKLFNESFYYKNVRHKIAQILVTCDTCQRKKVYNKSTFANLQSITPTGVGEILSCDFQGPFPTSIGGVKYIFSIVDIFSKYVTLFFHKKRKYRNGHK